MSNFVRALSVASLLALLACSACAREPSKVSSEQATLVAGDVVPKRIYARPLARNLAGETLTSSRPTSPKRALQLGATIAPRVFKETMLFVPAGSSAGTFTIPIDHPAGASIYALPGGGGDVALSRAARADLALSSPSGAGVIHDGPLDALSVAHLFESHERGLYVIEVGAVAASAGMTIDVRIPESSIAMALTPSSHELLYGDEGVVVVDLADGASSIDGATIEARLLSPITRTKSAPLSVRARSQGRYEVLVSSAFRAIDPIGVQHVEVRAVGASHGVAFDRFGSVAFHFGVPTARIASTSTPRLVRDEDGKVRAFEVDVALESASRDRLELTATLVDGDERPGSIANTTVTLDEGAHLVTLRFDAGDVALAGLDGPLRLRNLRLFSLGTNTLFHALGRGLDVRFPVVARAELAGQTALTPATAKMIEQGAFEE